MKFGNHFSMNGPGSPAITQQRRPIGTRRTRTTLFAVTKYNPVQFPHFFIDQEKRFRAAGHRNSFTESRVFRMVSWPALRSGQADYIAWLGDLTQLGLADALATCFGPPAAT
jgi:hypothetical protein